MKAIILNDMKIEMKEDLINNSVVYQARAIYKKRMFGAVLQFEADKPVTSYVIVKQLKYLLKKEIRTYYEEVSDANE